MLIYTQDCQLDFQFQASLFLVNPNQQQEVVENLYINNHKAIFNNKKIIFPMNYLI